jgi:hypothetical protein
MSELAEKPGLTTGQIMAGLHQQFFNRLCRGRVWFEPEEGVEYFDVMNRDGELLRLKRLGLDASAEHAAVNTMGMQYVLAATLRYQTPQEQVPRIRDLRFVLCDQAPTVVYTDEGERIDSFPTNHAIVGHLLDGIIET